MLLEAQPPAGPGELAGSVAGAVVGHDALDDDAERCVVGDGGLEEGYGTALALALHELAEGHAGGVVDADMDELPADTAAVALALAVTGDAVADLVEFAELFDVDVDHLAGLLALVTAGGVRRVRRGRRFHGAPAVAPVARGGGPGARH